MAGHFQNAKWVYILVL